MELADLVKQMRELGVTECRLPDGMHAVLGAEPVRGAPPVATLGASDLDAAAAKDKADEDAHYKFWRNLTASSGAPIPDYRRRG